MPGNALAYVYSGQWVAECPHGCGSVQLVNPAGLQLFHCICCRQLSEVSHPSLDEMESLMAVLDRRPIAYNRNWYPSGHPVAVAHRLPHGQTVQDLIDENTEHGVM